MDKKDKAEFMEIYLLFTLSWTDFHFLLIAMAGHSVNENIEVAERIWNSFLSRIRRNKTLVIDFLVWTKAVFKRWLNNICKVRGFEW